MGRRASSRPGPTSVGRCRSCHALVEWLPHVRTRSLAPIQVAPAGTLGNIAITEDGSYTVVAPGEGPCLNHFASCPAAASHHKGG